MRRAPCSRRLALAAAAAGGALTACGPSATQPGGPRPDVVTATVVAVGPPAAYTAVLVDTTGRADRPDDFTGRYFLQVGPSTAVLARYASGALRPAGLAAAAPGATVRAWRDGVELRSDPPQYPVTRLEVTRAAP